jgi:CheY-like chemotaxis protein
VQNAIDQERVRLEQELAQRLAAMTVQSPKIAAEAHSAPAKTQESKEQVEAEYTVKLLQTKENMEAEVQGKLEAARLMLHEEALEKVRTEYANVQEELQRQFEQEKLNLIEREQAKAKERLIEAYRTFIILMDVSIPRENLETLLLSLRSILGISDEEHQEILRSVQVNSYIDTLRASWQKGKITAEERELLAHLCELYHISQEEHERLTKQVKRQLGLPDENARILAIDDSKDLLVFVDYVLKKTYVNIRTVESVKQAVEIIHQELPSLILCDVMMPETGGFAFYDMIQKGEFGEELKKVPFVFMSGCSDEYMKKIADDMGVNKYLAKPFSKETLEKTIKEMLITEVG